MSSQIIPLKARADSPDPSRIPPTQTTRVGAAAPGIAARGWVLPESSAGALQGGWPSFDVAEKARIDRSLLPIRRSSAAPKPATIAPSALDFSAKRACV